MLSFPRLHLLCGPSCCHIWWRPWTGPAFGSYWCHHEDIHVAKRFSLYSLLTVNIENRAHLLGCTLCHTGDKEDVTNRRQVYLTVLCVFFRPVQNFFKSVGGCYCLKAIYDTLKTSHDCITEQLWNPVFWSAAFCFWGKTSRSTSVTLSHWYRLCLSGRNNEILELRFPTNTKQAVQWQHSFLMWNLCGWYSFLCSDASVVMLWIVTHIHVSVSPLLASKDFEKYISISRFDRPIRWCFNYANTRGTSG